MTAKDYRLLAKMCAELRKMDSTYDAEAFAVVRMKDVEDRLADVLATDRSERAPHARGPRGGRGADHNLAVALGDSGNLVTGGHDARRTF